MPIANLQQKSLTFDDNGGVVPQAQGWNWARNQSGICVSNPSESRLTIPAGTAQTVFNGTVATSMDNTTSFNVTTNPFISNTYRFTFSTGTPPVFKTDRGLTLSGSNITIAIGLNGTATFTSSSGSLSGLQSGDIVFIPGLSTGDSAGPFDTSNEGSWVVMTPGSLSVTLTRLGAFNGYSQTVAVVANSQVVGFANDKVAIGNILDILGGFNPFTFGSFKITRATPSWIEVLSPTPLPTQSGVAPSTANMAIYSALKRWVRIESTGYCIARFNGDSSSTNRINPIYVNSSNNYGYLEKMGGAYSLSLYNNSAAPISVTVLSFE